MATALDTTVLGMNIKNMVKGVTMVLAQASSSTSAPSNTFTQANIDDGIVFCTLTGDKTVGKGSSGDPLYGQVLGFAQQQATETVALGTDGDTELKYLKVKVFGMLEGAYNSATASDPSVGDSVVVDGAGKVIQTPAVASNGTAPAGKVANDNQVVTLNSITATTDDKPIHCIILKGGGQV